MHSSAGLFGRMRPRKHAGLLNAPEMRRTFSDSGRRNANPRANEGDRGGLRKGAQLRYEARATSRFEGCRERAENPARAIRSNQALKLSTHRRDGGINDDGVECRTGDGISSQRDDICAIGVTRWRVHDAAEALVNERDPATEHVDQPPAGGTESTPQQGAPQFKGRCSHYDNATTSVETDFIGEDRC
jgi:hypothetical protein